MPYYNASARVSRVHETEVLHGGTSNDDHDVVNYQRNFTNYLPTSLPRYSHNHPHTKAKPYLHVPTCLHYRLETAGTNTLGTLPLPYSFVKNEKCKRKRKRIKRQ